MSSNEVSTTDLRFLELAVELALATERLGNLPIGAVLVWRGEVVATGVNQTVSPLPHPGRHAEVMALWAVPEERVILLPGMTCYTTLEPCVMCLGTLLLHKIGRVVFGATDPCGGGTALLRHLPPAVAQEAASTQWVGPAAPALCDPLYTRAAARYWRGTATGPTA